MKPILFLLAMATIALSCTQESDDVAEPGPQQPDGALPASILAGQTSGGGIAHVDFNPDISFLAGPNHLVDSTLLDMNADGEGDFMVTYRISDPYMLGASFVHFDIEPLDSNQVCITPGDTALVDALAFGDVINSSLTWTNSSSILYRYAWSMSGSSSAIGYFVNDSSHYVGLRVYADGNAYYSWLLVHDFALDGYAITTGS